MIKLYNDDCLTVLRNMESNTIDSIVTDPPYGIKYMSKKWDYDIPDVSIWEECLRVIKPGAYLLSFSSPRTYHRMACAIEDAGFEIRDQLQWIHNQGFPTGFNPKEFDGWGTNLKPAFEPIVLARKKLDGTVLQNMIKWNTGALNIGGSRVDSDEELGRKNNVRPFGSSRTKNLSITPGTNTIGKVSGRWPSNVIHDGSQEVLEHFPVTLNGKSSSRFFYCAKASASEIGDFNTHPTVKPLKLLQYLVRLVTPVEGTVLDPFMGSGTTGVACNLNNFSFIGIDKEKEYYEIAKQRTG